MYIVQNDIVILSYVGPMEERKLSMLIKTVLASKDKLRENKASGFVLSIKNAVYNLDTLSMLVNHIKNLDAILGFPVAISDYSAKAYESLKSFTKGTNLKLIGNTQSAALFFSSKFTKKNLSILVYDENEYDMDKISSYLTYKGYKVRRSTSKEDFNKEASSYDIAITHCCLNSATNKPDTIARPPMPLKLSKSLIINLPMFVDTAVETLVSYTGMDAKKSSHKIRAFDTELGGKLIVAMMGFGGDICGRFILIFPEEVANAVLEAMIGEGDADEEALLDVIGEICNIITGSAKTKLSANKIKVVFDLPQKFPSIKPLLANLENDAQGVWIDMQLDGNPFYMFITK